MKILITGASSGIGYEISKELINEKHKLVLHYNKNKKKLQPLLTKNTHTVSQDLSSSLGAQQLYEQTIDYFGFPDVLINNAGIAISSSVDTDADFWNSSWNKTLNVNLAAPAYLSKCFINMKRNKNIHSRFRIINISLIFFDSIHFYVMSPTSTRKYIVIFLQLTIRVKGNQY